MILYPSSVYFVSVSDISDYFPSSLSYYFCNEKLINEMLLSASMALFTFSYCLYRFPIKRESDYYKPIINVQIIKYAFWLFLPIALYLNSISNWTTGDRIGLIPSLTAYSRNILTVIVVILFISPANKLKEKIVYLLFFMLVTFLSTQRTNALIVIIAFVYNVKSEKKAFKYLIYGITALIVLGSVRNGISPINIAYPIMGEGIYGSWGLLQAIDVIEVRGYSFTQFFLLFNSSFNWILKTLHISFLLPELSNIITESGEVYYPMGGFFYLSDAYLMHPFWGSVVYTFIIYWIFRHNVNRFYQNHDPLNLICIALLFDAIKGALWTFLSMLVFHVLFYFIILKLFNNNRK